MIHPATSAYWYPSWLRKRVLFTFMATFITLDVGLILVWYFVNRYDGIPLVLTKNHYAWTYGPTVLLTAVVSLWRRVNYCILVNQPWQELHNGPQDASQTMLLDYIWPLQITSLISALRNKHLAVASSITIFGILKVVMVISTTLFELRAHLLSQEIDARLIQKFDGSTYENYTGRNLIGSDPVWDLWNLRERYGDTTPPIELSIAFTNYSFAHELPVGALEWYTSVDVFRSNVTCEPAIVDWPRGLHLGSLNLTLSTPSCDIGKIEVEACFDRATMCNSAFKFFLTFWSDCIGGFTDSSDSEIFNVAADENRFVMIVIDNDPFPYENDPTYSYYRYGINIRRIAAVSCEMRHSINKGIIQGSAFDTGRVESLQIIENAPHHISHFSDSQVLRAVLNTTISSDTITIFTNIRLLSMHNNLLGLLAGSRSITAATLDPLFNVTLLQSSAEETMVALSHQVMRRYFLVFVDVTTSGRVERTDQRLYTRVAALWAMVGLLAIAPCLVIVIIIYIKQGVAPQNPATLATAAYTMSRSPTIHSILGEYNASRLSKPSNNLSDYHFMSIQDRVGLPRIEATPATHQEMLPKPPSRLSRVRKWGRWKNTMQLSDSKQKTKRPWMPYSSRRHAITLALLLPTISIVVLESLWYLSENDERFVTISSGSSIATYAIRYGSTTAVLIVSTLFNSLDFTIATMTPFSVLAAGDATTERTMFFTIVENLPPVALYKAIYHMHVGAALSLVASTIGSLLTVAVSSLWFYAGVEISQKVTLEVQSGWNISFIGNVSSKRALSYSGTTSLFNKLAHGSYDEATLIWGNVVLPRISSPQPSIASELAKTFDDSILQYNIDVPAVRPFLECDVLPQSAITIEEGLPALITATALLPAGCIDGSSSSGRHDATNFTHSYYGGEWSGQIYDLEVILSPDSTLSEGCPSLGVLFGRHEGTDSAHLNMTALLCTQRLHLVNVNVTYPGHSSSLFAPNLNTNVHLNPSIPKNAIDTESGSSSLSTRIADYFYTFSFSGPGYSHDDTFDPFFHYLVYGPQGNSREYFLGSGNSNVLISAINSLYQDFMVRVIDLEWRLNINSENITQPVPDDRAAKGTVTSTVLRLKLNETSKIVLETFLGTMVLLGGLAYRWVDLRVLPRNPYPIASRLALFAGSRLIGATTQIPSGSGEQEPVRTIKRKPLVILKGRRFRLGWWKDLDVTESDDSESDCTSHASSSMVRRRFRIDFEGKDVSPND